MSEQITKSRGTTLRRAAVTVAGLAVAASLYAFFSARNHLAGGDPICQPAKAVAERLKPLAKGEVAALQVLEKPGLLRPLAFQNAKGEAMSLEAFKGKAVLVNLWATWCAPCRAEMPALDRLQGELGGADFEVVAINIDTRNFEKPKQFLDEIKVARLAYHADPSAKIFQELKAAGRAFGMPTTLLLDKNGCELAWLAGPAEWSSPDALAFVRAALGR